LTAASNAAPGFASAFPALPATAGDPAAFAAACVVGADAWADPWGTPGWAPLADAAEPLFAPSWAVAAWPVVPAMTADSVVDVPEVDPAAPPPAGVGDVEPVVGTTAAAAACCAASAAAVLGSTEVCVAVAPVEEPSCDEVVLPDLEVDELVAPLLPLALLPDDPGVVPVVPLAFESAPAWFEVPGAGFAVVGAFEGLRSELAEGADARFCGGGEDWAGAGDCGADDCVSAALKLLSTSAEKGCDDELLSAPLERAGANELVTLLSDVTLNTGGLAYELGVSSSKDRASAVVGIILNIINVL